MASHDQGTKQMSNEGKPKRRRIMTLSQIESHRSPVKNKSPLRKPRKIQFSSAHALVRHFQAKREQVLAACGDDRFIGMKEKKASTSNNFGESKMPKKKINNEDKCQSKKPMKMVAVEEDQSKKPKKRKNTRIVDEGESKMALKNMILTNEDASKSKVQVKKNIKTNEEGQSINEDEGQSGKSTRNTPMKTSDEDDNFDTLIPAMPLDEFFEKYGISLDENDEESDFDHDDHNASVGDSSDSNKSTKKKRTRGPTQLKHIHAMEGLIELTWSNGKPIGPTSIQDQQLSRFLGTLARNSKSVTLLYTNWQAVPKETKTSLLDYAKVISEKNRENRSKQKWNHRMGPVSFEFVRTELCAKNENNEEPSQSQMFVATRTNKKGETDSNTQEKIEHLQNLKESGYSDDDAVEAVSEKEKPRRLRFYGQSVTKSSLKQENQIRQIQQQHSKVVANMEKNQNNLTCRMDGLTTLVKALLQQFNLGMKYRTSTSYDRCCPTISA